MQAINNYVVLEEISENLANNGDLLPTSKKTLQVVSVAKGEEIQVGDKVIADVFASDRQKMNGKDYIIVKINQIKVKL